MSITIIVDGEINISAKKGIEINSGGNIEINTKGKYIVRGEQGGVVYGNNPKNIPPMEVVKTIIKTRLKENYNGEFGFDWLDVNPFSREIEKIQGVDFSNVEYFYKAGNTPDDLGNILSVQGNEIAAKDAVANSYQLNRVGAYVDMPYVLMKKGQEIILQTQVEIYEGELTNDTLSITGDDYFEFELVGGTKTGKRSEIKLSSKEQKIDLKVTCLQEIARQKTYEYKYKNDVFHVEIGVGGLAMMENTTLKLKFRVIALVSNENDPNSKAKALFKQFKEAGVKDYLNKNSLNQAGYEVEIENFDAMDNADVDEYFYAFDKADWGSPEKRYFSRDETRLRYFEGKNADGELDTLNEIQEGQVGDFIWETTDAQGQIIKKIKRNNIEIVTIEEYKNKIKGKYKEYKGGGFIILCNLENSQAEIAAFSKSNPLDNYTLFMNNPSIKLKEIYSHEIGHMLGLSHTFYTQLEIDAYENAKKSIIGNNEPQYLDTDLNNDGKKDKNPNYYEGYDKYILNEKADYEINKYSGYILNDFYLENDKLILYLKNYNSYHLNDLKIKNYDENYKQKTMSNISINKNIIEANQNSTDCKYKFYKMKCYVLPHDYFLYLERRRKYLYDIILQLQSNVVFYKQRSTKNFLDYFNTRLFFSHNQILTMRDDSKNFIEEICTCKHNNPVNQNVISKPVQTKIKK